MWGLGRKVGYLWQNILNFKRLAVGDRREAFSSIWMNFRQLCKKPQGTIERHIGVNRHKKH